MKKVLLLIGLALSLNFSAKAQVAVIQPGNYQTLSYVNIPTNSLTNVIQGVSRVINFTITSTNGVGGNIYFYDAPTNLLTYSYGAYSNLTYSLVSITNVYTNTEISSLNYPNGTPMTNIYTASQATTNSVAAGTNNYTLVASYYLPANNTLTISSPGIKFYQGLLISNNVPYGINITYAGPGN